MKIVLKNAFFGGLARHFQLDSVADERGVLMPIEFGKIDFFPQHAFVVTGRDGVSRGGHAHHNGRQLLVCVSGEVEVLLSFEGSEIEATLCGEANTLLVSAPIWARQTYRGVEPRLLVFSDHPYDPEDYVLGPP